MTLRRNTSLTTSLLFEFLFPFRQLCWQALAWPVLFWLIQLVLFVLYLDTKENLAHSRHCSVMSFVVSNPHIVCFVATTDQIHISVLGLSGAALLYQLPRWHHEDVLYILILVSFERNAAGLNIELWNTTSSHTSPDTRKVLNSSLQDVLNTSRNQKLSTRFQKNLFSFENISSTTPRAYTPKAHAVQTLQRCGVEKTFRDCLLITTIKLNKARFSNEATAQTYAIFIHIGNRDPTVSTHSRIQSSLAYRFSSLFHCAYPLECQ